MVWRRSASGSACLRRTTRRTASGRTPSACHRSGYSGSGRRTTSGSPAPQVTDLECALAPEPSSTAAGCKSRLFFLSGSSGAVRLMPNAMPFSVKHQRLEIGNSFLFPFRPLRTVHRAVLRFCARRSSGRRLSRGRLALHRVLQSRGHSVVVSTWRSTAASKFSRILRR